MSNVLCLDPESLEIGDLIVLNGRAFDVEKHTERSKVNFQSLNGVEVEN